MRNILFMITLYFVSNLSAKQLTDFPLWGSTWLIGKGQNHRIYPTVTKSIPTHLIKIEFPSSYYLKSSPDKCLFKISYAVLTNREYTCSSDFIDAAVNQLNSPANSIKYSVKNLILMSGTDKELNISLNYQTLNDTVYSCEESFRKIHGYAFYRMIYNGQEITYYPGSPALNDKKWHKTNPVAWGAANSVSRRGLYTFKDEDNSRFYKDANQEVSEDGWKDYCDNEFCYERIYCTDYKTVPFSYWQVHLFPLVKWFPRDIFTGNAILNDNLKMDFKTAQLKKQESLKNPDNVELKYYRNPYFSDSASCVISLQFIDNTIPGDIPLNQRDFISTQYFSENEKENEPGKSVYFDHIPGRIVRVKTEMNAVERAILRLYAEDSLEDAQASSVYSRCSYNWPFLDKEVGKRRYQPLQQKTGEPLIMDSAFSEKRYFYHGCPCLEITELNNFTAPEIRGFIYQAPPLCSVKDMANAMYVYQTAFEKLNDPADRSMVVKRILTVHAALIDRIDFYTKNNLTDYQIDKYSRSCPESWIKFFPSYSKTYTDNLKAKAERLVSIVQKLKTSNTSIDSGINQIASMW
jgi:hypothetical protein